MAQFPSPSSTVRRTCGSDVSPRARTAALALGAWLICVGLPAAAQPAPGAGVWPSVAEAQAALDAAVRPGSGAKGFQVERILGCLPAHQVKGVWVCPVQVAGQKHVFEFNFERPVGQWRLREQDTQPACAPYATAEAAFRQQEGHQGLKVKGSVDEGSGLFTDQRGMLRDRRGPYRLMCRYDVAKGSTDWLYITYVWHDGQHYIVDADVEKWPD